MEFIDFIIGVIFAVTAGITVPFIQSYVEKKSEKEKIAKAFYYEILTLQCEYQLGIPGDHLQKLGYLYPDTGLYFVLRKEMYIFDNDLVEKLDHFYSRLLGVNASIRASKDGDKRIDYTPMLKQSAIDADPILDQLNNYF